MKILACNSNEPLAESIADHLKMELTQAEVKRFSDQEIHVEIKENVRGEDVFVIQSTSYPANDHVMELLIALDALRRGRPGGLPRCRLITAMPARTVNPVPGHRFRPSWWRI